MKKPPVPDGRKAQRTSVEAQTAKWEEKVEKLELEMARLRLATTVTDGLAHELEEAMKTLIVNRESPSVNQREPLWESMQEPLFGGMARILRQVQRIRFTVWTPHRDFEDCSIEDLMEVTRREVILQHSVTTPDIEFHLVQRPLYLRGDREALRFMLSNILLNILGAKEPSFGISIRAEARLSDSGEQGAQMEFVFSERSAIGPQSEKFFVPHAVYFKGAMDCIACRNIIELHRGKMAILTPKKVNAALRITIPAKY